MGDSKEKDHKETPSPRSMNELMNLIMKLNDKIRQKILSGDKKKDEKEPDKMEVVIIIVNAVEKKNRPVKASRSEKPKAPKDDWIQGLCEEIERDASPRRNS